jgi:ubiquinone biosynthesis protein UbiJ
MTPQEELAALGEEVEDLRRAVASLLEKVDKLTREG